MEFVLDTNVYRNLARKLDLMQVPAFAEKLINAEKAINSKSVLSIVVSMELIQHLLEGDLSKEECYKALCLQYFHTSSVNYRERKRQGNLYPPMNIILTKFFFNENSKYLTLYNSVLELISKLAEPLNISVCAAYGTDIKTIKEQLIFEKEEFKDNLEEYLMSLNKGVLDWGFFRNSKEERKKYFRELQNGKVEILLAISLMFRAHRIMEYDELVSNAEQRLNDFLIEYSAALKMCVFLLEQVGHGTDLRYPNGELHHCGMNKISYA